MAIASNLPLWNSIRPGQHWVLEASGDVHVQDKKKLSICQIFSGCNSLANNIHAMTQQILSDYSGIVLNDGESAALNVLKGKIAEKVRHYNESHCCIYLLAMKLFGRDANAAQEKFNEAINGIYNFQNVDNRLSMSPAMSKLNLHLNLRDPKTKSE